MKKKQPDKSNALYTNEKLVSLYDTLNPWGQDNDFYFRLVGNSPQNILDVGCGTGTLAIKYAEFGHNVVGIDPAFQMIAKAMSKKNGKLVDWHVSTLQKFTNRSLFDFIIMSGHAFQCLHSDEDISEAFKSIFHLLRPTGSFVFESRNPKRRVWEHWIPEKTFKRLVLPNGVKFEMFHNVIDINEEFVTFEEHYLFEGSPEPIISQSTLRFAPYKKIKVLAAENHLIVDSVWGSWDGSIFEEDSPEIIVKLRQEVF